MNAGRSNAQISWRGTGIVAGDPGDIHIYDVGTQGVVEFTNQLTHDARMALALPGGIIVPDGAGSRWQRPGAPVVAVVSSDATEVPFVGAVFPQPTGAALLARVRGMPVVTGDPPTPRTQFGATVASSEDALFVVGGVNEDGSLPKDLWRFDALASAWFPYPITGIAPEAVLATVFRGEDRALYVVDEVSQGAARFARMLRIGLDDGVSTLMFQVPRHAWVDRVYLTNTWRGELLLVGSSKAKERYVGVALAVPKLKQGATAVTLSFSGKGVVALAPTLTKRGLSIPLVGANGSVRDLFVRADEQTKKDGTLGDDGHRADDCL